MLWIVAGLGVLVGVTVLSFLRIFISLWKEDRDLLIKGIKKLTPRLFIYLLIFFLPVFILDGLYGTWMTYPEILGFLPGVLFWIPIIMLFLLPFVNLLNYGKTVTVSSSLGWGRFTTRSVKITVYGIALLVLTTFAFSVIGFLDSFESGSGLDFLLIYFYALFLIFSFTLLFPYLMKIPDKRREKITPRKKDYGIQFFLLTIGIILMIVFGSTVAFFPVVYHNDIEDNVQKSTAFPDIVQPEEIRLVPWSVAHAYLERVYGDAAAYLDTNSATLSKNTHPTVVNGEFIWLNVPEFEPWKWLGDRKLPFYVMVNATGHNIEAKRVNVEMKVSTSNIEWDWRVCKIVRNAVGENYKIAEVRFDLDDNYHPYYIAYLAYQHPPFFYETLDKLVIIDAVSGNAKAYTPKNAPSWLEVVYPDEYVYKWIKWWAQDRYGWYYSNFIKSNLYNMDLSDAKFLLINGTSYWYIPLRQMQSHVLGGYVLVNTRTGKPIFYDRSDKNYVDYSTAWAQLYTYLSSGEMGYMQLAIREGYLYAINAGNSTVKEVYILPLYAGLSLQKVAIIDPINYQNKPIIADDVVSALEMFRKGINEGKELHTISVAVDGIYLESTTAYIYENNTIISINKATLKYGNNSADDDWLVLQIAYSKYMHGDNVTLYLTMLGDEVVDVSLG